MLDMFRVKRTCENVLRRSFHVQSITSPKAELRRWTNIELNPTNQKWIRKKPNQIRSTMARVRADPDHKSRYECPTIVRHFENRERLEGKFTDLRTHDTITVLRAFLGGRHFKRKEWVAYVGYTGCKPRIWTDHMRWTPTGQLFFKDDMKGQINRL